MNKFQLGYYAHSKKKYNSEQEKSEYDFINKTFFGLIICPNKHIGEIGSIGPYLDIVEKMNVIFTSEYQGCVGKGVYDECALALKLQIPVYVIKEKENKFYYSILTKIEIVNEYDFKKYAALHTKKYSPEKLPVILRL